MFLQISFTSPASYYGIGIVVVLAVIYFSYRQVKKQQAAREARSNPRSQNINETNYNISQTGIDGHRLPDSASAASNKVADTKEKGEVPTNEEFYETKKQIRS